MALDLFGNLAHDKTDIKKYCCEPCFYAREDKCVCKCCGTYHGLGKLRDLESEDKVLAMDIAKEFLETAGKDLNCICGAELAPPVYYYEHDGGYKVKGFDRRLWLYLVCGKCGYQMALWKLRIPGKAPL